MYPAANQTPLKEAEDAAVLQSGRSERSSQTRLSSRHTVCYMLQRGLLGPKTSEHTLASAGGVVVVHVAMS